MKSMDINSCIVRFQGVVTSIILTIFENLLTSKDWTYLTSTISLKTSTNGRL